MLSVDGGQETLVVLRVGGSASSKWALGSGGDLVTQSCPTLLDPMDCRPSWSSVPGILQSRILEWVVILFSRGSYQARDQTQVSFIAGRFFTM